MNHVSRRDAGLAYLEDETVQNEMLRGKRLIQELNSHDRTDISGIKEIVKKLFKKSDNPTVIPPFYCDYGFHIEVGRNFFANFNCTIVDVCKVIIGDNCMFAPNVSIYTGGHPIHPMTRNSGYNYGKNVIIGDNVWIGGNTVVLPGVTIGNNVVIGAGSVITKNIPDWSVAVGNPCHVIKQITESDKRVLYKNELIDNEAWKDILERS